ncbi:hypothetical protein PR048_020976 [Dryococelus australis]|uniref:Uncharacterized protein n=1 Tax=Dryococelus australis TaxID=614101 RepID=A0ABQ9GX17_9NEOP|nr:hypothetical protein PR048_020976 [Dryococelus australis]
MNPFRLTPPSYSNEKLFNYRISRARRVVGNTLGVMCLSDSMKTVYKPAGKFDREPKLQLIPDTC